MTSTDSGLTFEDPPKAEAMNVLLYGPPGVGKTTAACSGPGRVLLLNADRRHGSAYAREKHGHKVHEVRVTGRQQLEDAFLHVSEDRQPKFGTVVLDSVGEAHRILLAERSNQAVRPTLNQYGDTATELERFCRALCELPVLTVLVAHETRVQDEDALDRHPFTGTSNPIPGTKLMQMVDVVGYAGVRREEGKTPLFVAQLIDDAGRRGKDGTGKLGAWREMDLAEWASIAAPPPKVKAAKNKNAAQEAAESKEKV